MVVIGKGVGRRHFTAGSGHSPAKRDLDVYAVGALGHYTHEKDPLLSAAALATIDYMQKHGLVDHAREVSHASLERLQAMKAQRPLIVNVPASSLYSWESSS